MPAHTLKSVGLRPVRPEVLAAEPALARAASLRRNRPVGRDGGVRALCYVAPAKIARHPVLLDEGIQHGPQLAVEAFGQSRRLTYRAFDSRRKSNIFWGFARGVTPGTSV